MSLENKNGWQVLRASQFIGATGDGDLARDLDVPRYETGGLQPPTKCAEIVGLDRLGTFRLTRTGPIGSL